MRTRNPGHQASKDWRLNWISTSSEKCIYHGGRNCKCRNKAYCYRHRIATRGRAQTGKAEARQRWTPREKVCRVPWVRRSVVKSGLSYLHSSVLPGLCLPSGQLSVLFFHTWPIMGPSPGVQAPLSQDGTRSVGFWDEQDWLWPGIITWFWPTRSLFCTCVVSPLLQKSREGDPLILYSNRVLPLFVLAMTTTLWCLQETDIGYLLYFCCCFHFRGWTGGWLQMP